MRTQLIASLVSLSLSIGNAAQAQEALWFTPTKPATSASNANSPAASPSDSAEADDQSFSRRFGGLLSKPPSATPAFVEQSAINPSSAGAIDWIPASNTQAQPTAGARDFRIPWSRSTTSADSYFQATASVDKPPVKPERVSRGAQVSALATDVRPDYVQPPRAARSTASTQQASSSEATAALSASENTPSPQPRSRSLLAAVPWSSAPRASSTLATQQPVENPVAVKPVAVKPATEKSVGKLPAQETPVGEAVIAATPAASTASPDKPVAKELAADKPLLAESLLQPIPADRLLPSTSRSEQQLEQPAVAASLPPSQPHISQPPIEPVPAEKLGLSTASNELPRERRIAATLPQSQALSPHYLLVDTQQSASDLHGLSPQRTQGQAVAASPAITNHFSDQLDTIPSAATPARVPPPVAQAVSQPAPLLTTESMIGPLQGAENLFNRLEIEQDLRDVASRIESGPRGDASNYAWMPAAYTWISPAFYHHPLYFEQPNLERYGQGTKRVLQPIASSIHFFGSIPLVPYKTLTHHPREKYYTLGSMRPGNCVPLQRGVILGPSQVGEVTMFWEECSGY